MYDPKIGKWLSADPIGFEGEDANLYRYVGNCVTTATDHDGQIQRKTTQAPQITRTGFSAKYEFALDNEYDFDVTLIQKIQIEFGQWDCRWNHLTINPVTISYFEVVGHVAVDGNGSVQTGGSTSIDTWEVDFGQRFAGLLGNYSGTVKMEGQVRAYPTSEVQGAIANWQSHRRISSQHSSASRPRFEWTSGAFPASTSFRQWRTAAIEREFLPTEGAPSIVDQEKPVFNRIEAEWKPQEGIWEFVGDSGQHVPGRNSAFN